MHSFSYFSALPSNWLEICSPLLYHCGKIILLSMKHYYFKCHLLLQFVLTKYPPELFTGRLKLGLWWAGAWISFCSLFDCSLHCILSPCVQTLFSVACSDSIRAAGCKCQMEWRDVFIILRCWVAVTFKLKFLVTWKEKSTKIMVNERDK